MIGLENFYRIGANSPEQYDEIWVIMRYKPKKPLPGSIHVPELAPSPQLFNKFTYLRDQNLWDLETFRQEYAPQYIREITGDPESLEAIERLLRKAHEGFNIGLTCTCYREDLCHRSVLGGLIQSIAPDIECKAENNYSEYWNMEQILL